MVVPCDGIILLLAAGGGPALLGISFRLGVSYQTRVLTPLSEVHAPRYPGPDLSGSADAQHHCKNDVGKDEGSLRVTTPVETPPSFRGQGFCEAAPHRSGGRGVPDC